MDLQRLKAQLERCVSYHGHYCTGQILGVRIAVKGLELAACESPRDLIVVIENDRCIADAIQVVTGTRIGRRTMKLIPYGRMAATFVNLASSRAFRVNVHVPDRCCEGSGATDESFLTMPDEELLRWREVHARFSSHELPGRPQRVVRCSTCGEKVFDFRDLPSPSGPQCAACANGAYYTDLEPGP
jgi:formylmethanofuran dehydrogenase subunit E